MIDSEQNVTNNQILGFLLLSELNKIDLLNLTKFQIRENVEGLFDRIFLPPINNYGEGIKSHLRSLKCVANNLPAIYGH